MAPKAKAAPKPALFCDLKDRGVKLYYEWNGPFKKEFQDNPETLFMLMGSVGDLRRKSDQQYCNLTGQQFKVLTYDHRNSGQSTCKDEPCTIEDFADDAAALLRELIPDQLPVYVLGHSFGGMVAQHLAIRHPEVIKKLVLCSCATGGEGGTSFPIHEWYVKGTTPEERVLKKVVKANNERTDEWKKNNASTWAMVNQLLVNDEKIGINDPLKDEGTMRLLDARKGHNSWEKIVDLRDKMDVLCCSSPKDDITPPKLVGAMADRIGGSRCSRKLDFGWGHPFVAADETAMPWIAKWLREGPGEAPTWKIVGGADKGGILVRTGVETSSPEAGSRLSTGALVQQLALQGDRLNYKLLKGTGPADGWVSVKLGAKELAVLTEEKP